LDYPDEACDFLIEILSILYKTVRKVRTKEQEALVAQFVVNDEILSDL